MGTATPSVMLATAERKLELLQATAKEQREAIAELKARLKTSARKFKSVQGERDQLNRQVAELARRPDAATLEAVRREIRFFVGFDPDYKVPPDQILDTIRTMKGQARKWKEVAQLVQKQQVIERQDQELEAMRKSDLRP